MVLMWLVYGCFYLNRLNLSPVIPLIIGDLKISHAQVGLITSFFFAFYSASEAVLGYLSDILGPRKIIAVGAIVSALANIFFSTGSNLLHLIAAQSINGIGQGGGWGPSVKLLSSWFPRSEIGRILGIYATSVSVFTVLAYVLAGYLGKTFGWRVVFWIFPIVVMFVLAVYWMVVRDRPGGINFEIFQHRTTRPEEKHLGKRNKYLVVISNVDIRLASVAFACLAYISYTNLIWIPTYLYESYSVSVVKASLLSSLYPALGLVARPLGGYLSDVTFGGHRKPLLLMGFSFILFSNFFLVITNHLGWAMTWILCVGFFDSLIVALFFVLLVDILPSESMGTGAGLMNAVGHTGSVCAMISAGILVDIFHSYKPVFLVSAILSCLAITLIWRIHEHQSQP